MADDIALPVPGLRYLPDYLDGAAHDGLLATVDSLEWHQTGDGRRLQFYGYWYHHTKGMYRVGDLPGWASSLASVSVPGASVVTVTVCVPVAVNDNENDHATDSPAASAPRVHTTTAAPPAAQVAPGTLPDT